MASMDIFEGDAFSIIELTRALENIPFKPATLSGSGLFGDRGVRSRTVVIESRDGTLSLIPFSERGSAYDQQVPERRDVRAFVCRQFKKQDVIWASEIQGIRVRLSRGRRRVGILFGTTRDEAKRAGMMSAIAPYWDGNETWLVVIGASLFAAFPAVYAVFLGAFYLPVLLMLLGLIFRGVAFEFRYRSVGMRRFWDAGFFFGSLVVAFVQGAAVGAMMRGIPVESGQFAGDTLVWLHPFPVLTGIGLVFGYALLGAGWLAFKTEGALREWAHARIPWLVAGVSVLLGLAFGVSLTIDASAIAQSNLGQRPWGLVFPIVGLAALGGVLAGARARRNAIPYALTVVFFLAAFVTLGVMIWPYMIPYTLTVADAAAPDASLRFFFYGGIVVLPVIAAYTIGVYWLFRGKTERADE